MSGKNESTGRNESTQIMTNVHENVESTYQIKSGKCQVNQKFDTNGHSEIEYRAVQR